MSQWLDRIVEWPGCAYPMWQGYWSAYNMFWAHGVASYHKLLNTLRSQLVRPKDKTPLEKQCGLVYKVECGVCHKQYTWETERILGKRFKEHTDGNHPSSVVQEHIDLTCHPDTFDHGGGWRKLQRSTKMDQHWTETTAMRSSTFFSSSSHMTSLVTWNSWPFHLAINPLWSDETSKFQSSDSAEVNSSIIWISCLSYN